MPPGLDDVLVVSLTVFHLLICTFILKLVYVYCFTPPIFFVIGINCPVVVFFWESDRHAYTCVGSDQLGNIKLH